MRPVIETILFIALIIVLFLALVDSANGQCCGHYGPPPKTMVSELFKQGVLKPGGPIYPPGAYVVIGGGGYEFYSARPIRILGGSGYVERYSAFYSGPRVHSINSAHYDYSVPGPGRSLTFKVGNRVYR